MNENERNVQAWIVILCKSLPVFVDKWRGLLQDAIRPVQGMVNQAEQLRHVARVKLNDMDDFEGCREKIRFKICQGIEDELVIIKDIVDALNKLNGDIKNKLTLLENATLELDWNDDDSAIVKGSSTQPSLTNLLQFSLEFMSFFSRAFKNINASVKDVIVTDEKFMKSVESSFKLDLESKCVTSLIALTQYVDNEAAVV